ncbi:hypothetical protein PENTCL1PPCAC_3753, partial [Pristionchus entomophagus]
FSTMCTVRKASEMSSLNDKSLHDLLKTGEMALIPSNYSMLIPTSQMFLCAVMDFAQFSFSDFRKLSNEDRHSIVRRNFQLIQSLDGSYRAQYLFPNDDTVMATYMSFVNEESLNSFFDGCHNEIVKSFAIERVSDNCFLFKTLIHNCFKISYDMVGEYHWTSFRTKFEILESSEIV